MMERIQKIWSIICKILNAFFLVVLIGLIVILLYLAIGSKGNGLPFLQNYQMFTVLSGSMEPTLNVGGVIIVEKVDPMTLQEGDIITFISNDTSLSGQVVSHRIIQVVDNNNGRMFITKGDANEDRDDAAAVPTNVIGRVIFHIPYLGYLLNFMKTRNGFFFLLLLPCMIILFVESISLLKNFWAYQDEKKALKEGKSENASDEQAPSEQEALPDGLQKEPGDAEMLNFEGPTEETSEQQRPEAQELVASQSADLVEPSDEHDAEDSQIKDD